MNARERLAQEAVKAAMRLRAKHGRSLDHPLCVVDLALDMGIEVRFEPAPSLEGLYSPAEPSIVLGSLRSEGRRNYTCGHELGHHLFGHGLRVDELIEQRDDDTPQSDEEYIADRFAAALLMPKLAVEGALAARGWNPEGCTPRDVFALAGTFGVGYATLVGQLHSTLRLLSAERAQLLRKRSPKSIRAEILGTSASTGLVIADRHWTERPIDLQVADVVLLPRGCVVDGAPLVLDDERRGLWRAVAQGSCKVRSNDSVGAGPRLAGGLSGPCRVSTP